MKTHRAVSLLTTFFLMLTLDGLRVISAAGDLTGQEGYIPGKREIAIPTVDVAQEIGRQVVVAAGTPAIYQGHATTVLMPDNKTMFCVWSIGHGGPCGPIRRSNDGGLTWSDIQSPPDNWTTVRNCPAIFRLVDPQGQARLFVFAGQGPDGTMYQLRSEDGGRTWSPMRSNGLKSVMPLCTIQPVAGGQRLLGMTNIRRPGETREEKSNVVAQSVSDDGGLTWSRWEVVLDIPGCKPCEPCLIRSPNGSELLCLIRENNRTFNSWIMTSDDDGNTWSPPRQAPAAVSGDRHDATCTPDGRLFIAFRDTAQKSPTRNHFVGWVGTFEDLLRGREGDYRVKLLHSYAGSDCGYAAVEQLPDGTIIATTYIKYWPDERKHSVVSTRFTLSDLDAKAR